MAQAILAQGHLKTLLKSFEVGVEWGWTRKLHTMPSYLTKKEKAFYFTLCAIAVAAFLVMTSLLGHQCLYSYAHPSQRVEVHKVEQFSRVGIAATMFISDFDLWFSGSPINFNGKLAKVNVPLFDFALELQYGSDRSLSYWYLRPRPENVQWTWHRFQNSEATAYATSFIQGIATAAFFLPLNFTSKNISFHTPSDFECVNTNPYTDETVEWKTCEGDNMPRVWGTEAQEYFDMHMYKTDASKYNSFDHGGLNASWPWTPFYVVPFAEAAGAPDLGTLIDDSVQRYHPSAGKNTFPFPWAAARDPLGAVALRLESTYPEGTWVNISFPHDNVDAGDFGYGAPLMVSTQVLKFSSTVSCNARCTGNEVPQLALNKHLKPQGGMDPMARGSQGTVFRADFSQTEYVNVVDFTWTNLISQVYSVFAGVLAMIAFFFPTIVKIPMHYQFGTLQQQIQQRLLHDTACGASGLGEQALVQLP